MIAQTEALVLSSLKYGDSHLIVKTYTQNYGVVSFMLKGVLKHRSKSTLKAAYFQPLTQLILQTTYRSQKKLQTLKEARLSYNYATLYTNIYKSTIAMFLAEVLSLVLKEEDINNELFSFLTTSFKVLDNDEEFANFHLLFLVQLTRYLGFKPNADNNEGVYFNLEEARFENAKTILSASKETTLLLKKVLQSNFNTIHEIKLNALQRGHFLVLLVHYYQIHSPGFKKPKSFEILNTLFK